MAVNDVHNLRGGKLREDGRDVVSVTSQAGLHRFLHG